jgi:hypothetical protein
VLYLAQITKEIKMIKRYGNPDVTTAGIINDFGIPIRYPELAQDHPSRTAEWVEKHKVLVATIGGTFLAAAGVVVGNMVFSPETS